VILSDLVFKVEMQQTFSYGNINLLGGCYYS